MSEKTMYDLNPAVAELNRVEGFEPKELMREIGESDNKQLYLDVAVRKLWFRLKYPFGMIHKRIIEFTEQFAIVEARVYLDKGDLENSFVSNAFARRFYNSENDFGSKYLEFAETAAVGRALADAGFGSQFADVEKDIDPNQVDAGVPISNSTEPANDKKSDDTSGVVVENGVTYQPTPTSAKPDSKLQSVKQTYTASTPVETILSIMTLDEAKNLLVTIGMNKNKKLGEIAISNPSDLLWYINSYKGPDNILRAAATLLMNAAIPEAG